MSMIGNVLRVTNDELTAFLENSSLLEDRIYNGSGEDAAHSAGDLYRSSKEKRSNHHLFVLKSI